MKAIKYLLAILLMSVMVYAQDKDYSNEPGYVDFGDLTQFEKEDNITEVFLEENLLKMVSKMSKDENGEVADLISNLKLIKVNVFQIDETNQKEVHNKVTELDKMLVNKKWDRIVKSRQKGEIVNVYIKQGADNKIAGLVVTTMEEGGEAAFVNIVGHIDLAQVGKLGSQFNIPSLNDVHKK